MCIGCETGQLAMPDRATPFTPYRVYAWLSTDDGAVHYVGSGTPARAGSRGHGHFGKLEILAVTRNRFMARIFEALVFEKLKPEYNRQRPAIRRTARQISEWELAEKFWVSHYANRWNNVY